MKAILLGMTLAAGLCLPTAGGQDLLVQHVGGASLPTLGSALLALDDVSGDGVPDYASAGPVEIQPGSQLPWGARLRVYSGMDGTQVYEHTASGFPAGPLHVALAMLGDLTGDGRPEIALGIAEDFSPVALVSRVEVLDGASGNLLYALAGAQHPRFGWSVENVGDVDGDGMSDLAVGAPGLFLGSFTTWGGMVSVFSGATGTILAPPIHAGFFSVSYTMDVGRVLLHLPDFDPMLPGGVLALGLRDAGRAEVLGLPSLTPVATVFGCPGSGPGLEPMGAALADMGDIDGDGASELAGAGVQNTGTGPSSVRVSIVGGSGSTCLYALNVPGSLGTSPALAALDDQDGDGIRDLAVGAPYQVHLFSGATGSAMGTLPAGPPATEVQVVGLGDLTGDGRGEILVGYAGAGLLQVWTLEPITPEVENLGSGFAPGPLVPSLQAALPLLGSTWTPFLSAAVPFSSGLLVVAPGPAVSTVLPSGPTVYPDLSRVSEWVILPFSTDIAGAVSFPFYLPFDFRLAGTEVILQAWFPAGGPSTTNGVRVRLGL